jgi:hypothetical protein
VALGVNEEVPVGEGEPLGVPVRLGVTDAVGEMVGVLVAVLPMGGLLHVGVTLGVRL